MGKGVWAGVGLLVLLVYAMVLDRKETWSQYESWKQQCEKSGGSVIYQSAERSLCVNNKFLVEVK